MFDPTLLNQASTKQLDPSMNQYNMSNFKATTKRLRARIKTNKLRVRMIFRAKKILQEYLKIKKSCRNVMLVSMNVANNSELQPSKLCAQHRK